MKLKLNTAASPYLPKFLATPAGYQSR